MQASKASLFIALPSFIPCDAALLCKTASRPLPPSAALVRALHSMRSKGRLVAKKTLIAFAFLAAVRANNKQTDVSIITTPLALLEDLCDCLVRRPWALFSLPFSPPPFPSILALTKGTRAFGNCTL